VRSLSPAILCAFLVLVLTLHSAAQPGTAGSPKSVPSSTLPTDLIYLVAGCEIPQQCYFQDGVPATQAAVNYPVSVIADGKGDLYIADSADSVVRFVSASTGIISTIAGNIGKLGGTGDGGPATSALLKAPGGIALDPSGNLYIADSGNCVVRKVDFKTGIINTVIGYISFSPGYSSCQYAGDGGLASDALLNDPTGLAFDSAGDLYIADTGSATIRRVDAKSGIITTVAGTCIRYSFYCGGYSGNGGPAAKAQLQVPVAIAFDSASNLYIADGNLIRRVDSKTSIITNAAGICTKWDPAISQGCQWDYTADGLPANEASLSKVVGVAFDPFGDLIFSDQDESGMIRKIDARTGILSTIAGQNVGEVVSGSPAITAGTGFANQIAFDKTGNLLIADGQNHAVYRVTGSTTPAAEKPVFTPPGQYWFDAGTFTVTMSDGSKDAKIYYTIDGSTPTTKSSLYSGPLVLDTDGQLTAFATAPGLVNGPATAEYYSYTSKAPIPAPILSPGSGTYTTPVTVSISEPDYYAFFFYTTNGSAPNSNSAPVLQSSYYGPAAGSVVLTSSSVLKVIAYNYDDFPPSAVATATYTINLPVLPSPTFSAGSGTYLGAQSIKISDANKSAAIYYTLDGASPDINSSRYSGAISIAQSATVKAIAVEYGYTGSPVASADYAIQLPPPAFSLKAGTYTGIQSVTITDSADGTKFYYTLDGSVPSSSKRLYSSPISITKSVTLKAVALKKGFASSSVTSAAYSIQLPAPEFSPKAGTYAGKQYVKLSDSIGGASIHYTLNGALPTSSSPILASTATLQISQTATVRAIAIETGYLASAVSSASFTLLPPPVEVTGAATNIGVNSATLNGTVNSEGAPTTWCFIYGGAPTAMTEKTSLGALAPGGTAVSVSAPITGLAPGKVYYFQIVAKSAAGASKGQVLRFTTK